MALKTRIASESWISHMSNKVKAGGGINLAQGIPGFDPPKQLLRILKDMSMEAVHQYPPGNGQSDLVKLICHNYRKLGLVSPDEMLIVQGATEGVSLVYTYMNKQYGNSWSSMAFDPVYESYNELPKIFNNELVKMPFVKGGEIDKELFESKVKSHNVKLVFINSPGNPYGKIWTEDEFLWLFSLAGKYDFFILLDAVYKDLYYGDTPPFNPIGINRERLFYINSFSKMLSITGWRVGYLICDNDKMKRIRAIHDYTGLCAPSILQYSISKFLELSDYGADYVESIRSCLNENYLYLKPMFEDIGFNVAESGGGYFIWCKLPEKFGRGVDFALQLYDKQKVAVVPGIHFSEDANKWVRINIARKKDELEQALIRIGKYVR